MHRICVLLGLVAALLPGLSAAQVTVPAACAPRDVVIDRLAARYGETRRSVGLGGNNAVMEVFASSESGTWTITVTNAAGITCLVGSGQAFETVAEILPSQADDV